MFNSDFAKEADKIVIIFCFNIEVNYIETLSFIAFNILISHLFL